MDLVLQSRFNPTAYVGTRNTGVWSTSSGVEVSNDAQKDRPPASKFGVSVPGLPALGNITLTRTFDADRDTDEFKAFMRNAALIGERCTVSVPILDVNNNPKSRETYVGIIIRYKHPDTDSNSSDKAQAEAEFQLDGVA